MVLRPDFPAGTLRVLFSGKAAGKPVVGDDLYRAVLQIFVGEHAIDPRMKQGLLGVPA